VDWVRSGREFLCGQNENENARYNERLWQIFCVEREDQKIFFYQCATDTISMMPLLLDAELGDRIRMSLPREQ